MTGLGPVQWAAVFGDLFAAAPREVLAIAARYAGRSDLFDVGPSTFAVLVLQMSPGELYRALIDHGAEVGDRDALMAWLYDTAHIVLAGMQAEDPPTRPFPTRGRVHVDRSLGWLPLLGALTERAGVLGRRLGVFATDRPGVGGACQHDATVTLPDGEQAGAVVVELCPGWTVRTWLHEAAHAFDPRHDRRAPEECESYADALADVLATLPVDAPYGVVRPHAEHVYGQVRTDYREHRPPPIEHEQAGPAPLPTGAWAHLPAPGLESVMAFAALPLIAP